MVDILHSSVFADIRAGGAAAFRALLENIDECVCLLDGSGRCVALSAALAGWLGRSEAELVGRGVADLWPPPFAEQEFAHLWRALRGERIDEEAQRPLSGRSIRVRIVKVPVRDESGAVRGVLCLYRDALERTRTPTADLVLSSRRREAATVLVVDTEPSIVRLARDVLQRHGYRVLAAHDGRQAIETYRRHGTAVDLVVLEQTMSDLSGLETMNELLALDGAVRVVLMTSAPEAEASWGSRLPGCRLLHKPWTADQLVRAVREVLAIERERRH